MKIPFKFLDPYKKADIGFYFGREADTIAIYEMVKKNRIVLVYGPSGTGKTSLIQCGLANKFDETDWLPFMVRRKENINNSLLESLKSFFANQEDFTHPTEEEIQYNLKYLTQRPRNVEISQSFFNEIGITFTDEEISLANEQFKTKDDQNEEEKNYHIARLISYLLKIAELSLRPIYLVFDQLEELLIYGSEKEKDVFLQSLKVITTSNSLVSCHVIILMREEFFAVFDKFKQIIPGISDRRLRVEPLQETDIKLVIKQTLKYKPFNIELEDEDANVDEIYNVLADNKKGEVSLPYLQVYLDQLWREDFARTYPEGFADETQFAPLKFTSEEIEKFGQISNVLQKFLTERKIRIAEKLNRKYPNIAKDFINKVLNEFVSDYGTKLPIIFEYANDKYFFPEITRKFFDGFPAEPLHFTLKKLEKYKLIRKEPRTLELAHDILAKLIDEQRDFAERRRIRIRVNIKDYLKSNEPSLSLAEVNEWEREIEKCNLSQTELDFFYKWREIRKKEESAKEMAEKEEQAARDLALQEEQAATRLALKEEEHRRKEAEFQLHYQEELKKQELEFEQQKKEEERKNTARKQKIMVVSLVSAVAVCVALAYGYITSKRFANKYYAFNFFASKADTISNKKDALKLSYYIYNKTKDYDTNTTSQIEASIIRLASDTSLQNIQSDQSISLFSSKQYRFKESVDLSADGKFICVEYDSLNVNAPRKKYAVFEVGKDEPLQTFDSVYYAYFLNTSNTLLLARSVPTNKNGINYPNNIVLYNCDKKDDPVTVALNLINPYYFLETEDFLRPSRYSEYDSYDIRSTSQGNLLIPVIDLESFRGQTKILFLDPKLKPINKPIPIDYSISSSRDNRFFGIATRTETDNLKIIDESGRSVIKEIQDIRWGDITPKNTLLFRKEDKLYTTTSFEQQNPRIKDSIPLVISPGFGYAYLLNNESVAIIKSEEYGIQVSSLANSPTKIYKAYPEELVGISYTDNTMMSIPRLRAGAEGRVYDSVLLRRNLNKLNDKPDSISFSTGIVNFMYNSKTGRAIVETSREVKSNKSFIYVIDKDLKKMGAFVLTPNDSYSFSKDGNHLLVINDNQLNIFTLRPNMFDFSNFQEILKWMSVNAPDSVLRPLKKNYQIRFPNVIF